VVTGASVGDSNSSLFSVEEDDEEDDDVAVDAEPGCECTGEDSHAARAPVASTALAPPATVALVTRDSARSRS
jgi:hypothetical protein